MTIFKTGQFNLHSGQPSKWFIDLERLDEQDWATLALMISNKVKFSEVIGIPKGGCALADALQVYKQDTGPILIVDDVLTTGKSMEEALRNHIGGSTEYVAYTGYVVIARKQPPSWVKALFQADID